jgi:N-acetyl-anhydromuramyl-L-alanine amidase AmpD
VLAPAAAQSQAVPNAAFAAAYARYPAIPRGTLEAIAYARTRGRHIQPQPLSAHVDPYQVDPHHPPHSPPAYGVMGLYAGQAGFAPQLAQAAALLGISEQRLIRDPASNILGAAALLDAAMRSTGVDAGRVRREGIETLAPALKLFSGFGGGLSAKSSVERSAVQANAGADDIQDYARASFAYEVLQALDTGRASGAAHAKETPIRWERAFDAATLTRLKAPFVRLDLQRGTVETPEYRLDPIDETLKRKALAKDGAGGESAGRDGALGNDAQRMPNVAGMLAITPSADFGISSADYPPALWVASPYHSTRSAAVGAVTIHTMQGTYAGSISWFQSNPYSVSAHYLVRSSDGQITQMVTDARAAHHVGSHNGYTIGIEHEGYIDNASWYTAAMYTASANLTKHVCARYGIDCRSAYNGSAHSGLVLLPTSTRIKGHQHFSDQTHTDPGIHWDWRRYYALLNPGNALSLDNFETGVGRFDTSPTYSGSTVGISTASSSARICDSASKEGNCRLRLSLQDNTASASAWQVRLLSASGQPTANAKLTKAGGHLGFWVYPAATGVSVALGVDDSDGTERSLAKAVPANTWTYVEWRLDDGAQWDAWAGGDGIITSTNAATLDAIWVYRADSNGANVSVAIDDVRLEVK